jgi:hypothetical protein
MVSFIQPVPVSVSETANEAAAEVGCRMPEELDNPFSEIISANVTKVDLVQRLRDNEHS